MSELKQAFLSGLHEGWGAFWSPFVGLYKALDANGLVALVQLISVSRSLAAWLNEGSTALIDDTALQLDNGH